MGKAGTCQGCGPLASADTAGMAALQGDAAICVAVLLACLGACLAPQLLGVAAVTQLAPHAALVACLAAVPPALMLACSHW